MPYAFTITERHMREQYRALPGDPTNGARDPIVREAGIVRAVIGVILPCDIGKRVYRISGRAIHQVENDHQMARRLGHT